MIKFDRFQLDNGLKVIVHHDDSTPIVAFNILYDVGARDEDESRTGFAHLFEHLMFGGSVNIPDFDKPLQAVGGSSNAFTNNDITNYYVTLPTDNLETAFWLDSDRMLSLAFSEKSLEVQRSVVIEEFKQRYLNQPYGDVWLLLRPLAYKVHPYKWATIGKEIKHIEDAVLADVKAFFKTHYHPGNAILCVAGNVETAEVKSLCEKWFSSIPAQAKKQRNLPKEPAQTEVRTLTVERDVPFDAIYKAWHMGSRNSADFYAVDLLSDILSRGKSSRLYHALIREQKLFSEVSAFISGDLDDGLFIISGKLIEGVSMEKAEAGIDQILNEIITEPIQEDELEKVKNKAETTKVFNDMAVLDKAMELCYFELLGDAAMVNLEIEKYRKVSSAEILNAAQKMIRPENCSTLYYLAKK
ncbi:MAG: insulinase family protein [Flavobacteriales bacterium]|nr:insulinase family protein [Flavobacteriales bacterium]